MNAYLTAFEEYEKHDREVSWTDALDYHFQRGAVITLPRCFVMCRPVRMEWPDEIHTSLTTFGAPWPHDSWHVWCVAGDLRELLALATAYGVKHVTYQRHDAQTLRRANIAQLSKRISRGSLLVCEHESAEAT
jgi:hypothetical protein